MSSMPQVRLGSEGPRVSALGLGCMAMSDMYGPSDRAESIATVHAALDAGMNLLDTGDFYGMGHNEMLLREALVDRQRDSYLLSVKFGSLRDPSGRFLGFDGRVNNSLFLIYRVIGLKKASSAKRQVLGELMVSLELGRVLMHGGTQGVVHDTAEGARAPLWIANASCINCG
jgi:hypothetical protein